MAKKEAVRHKTTIFYHIPINKMKTTFLVKQNFIIHFLELRTF